MSNFEGAGQESGLEIWRIEDFEAVPYDQTKYGKFHVGDSYIVLKVTMITISCTLIISDSIKMLAKINL